MLQNYFLVLIFLLNFFSETQTKFPKIVWIFWDSGFENAPLITKLCSKNHHYFLQKEWEIRQINHDSVQQWLNKIPNFEGIPDLTHFSHKKQSQANFIRLFLLRQFGGIWMDANTILVQDFNWLLELQNAKNIVNKYGQQPKLFMFYLSYYGSKQIIHDGKNDWKIFPGLQTWFIAAQPKAQFLTDWINQYKIYAQKGMEFKKKRLQQNDIVLGGLSKDDYLTTSQAMQYVLQTKQKQFDKEYGTQNRKLAVNYYNIWTMEASVGPLMIQKNFVNWNSFTLVKDLTQIHEDFLKRYINPKYFIKLSAKSYKVLQTSLEYSEGNYSLLSGIDSLMEGSWTNLVHPNSNYVLKDSIVSRYLFDKDPENYYKTIQDDYKMKQNCEPQFFILLCLYSFPFLLIGVLMMAFLIVRLKYKKSQYKKINVTERDYEQSKLKD